MSNVFAVQSQGPGYYPVGGTGAGATGSQSAMSLYDFVNKTYAQVLDAGIGLVHVAHAIYTYGTDPATSVPAFVPKQTAKIPAGAICLLSVVNSPTALAGTGSISVGTSAGSSATSILGSTTISTFTTDYVNVGAIVPTATNIIKMSAEGNIEITLTGTLTAGVFEVFVVFLWPQNL
jgi:hypothetical protein